MSSFGMRLNKEGTGRWPFIRTSLQDPRGGMAQLGHDLTEGPGRPNGAHKVQGSLPPSTGSPVGSVGPTIGEVHDLQTALRESILAAPQGRPGLTPDSVGCPGRDLTKWFSREWVGAFGRTSPHFLGGISLPLAPCGIIFFGTPPRVGDPPHPHSGSLSLQAPPFSSTIQSRRRPSALPRVPPPMPPARVPDIQTLAIGLAPVEEPAHGVHLGSVRSLPPQKVATLPDKVVPPFQAPRSCCPGFHSSFLG